MYRSRRHNAFTLPQCVCKISLACFHIIHISHKYKYIHCNDVHANKMLSNSPSLTQIHWKNGDRFEVKTLCLPGNVAVVSAKHLLKMLLFDKAIAFNLFPFFKMRGLQANEHTIADLIFFKESSASNCIATINVKRFYKIEYNKEIRTLNLFFFRRIYFI